MWFLTEVSDGEKMDERERESEYYNFHVTDRN